MTGADGGSTADIGRLSGERKGTGGRITVLEQALWKRFAEADNLVAFVEPWLALQCRYVSGATRGVVVLGDPGRSPLVPVAFFPQEIEELGGLSAAAELAVKEKSGVVHKEAVAPEGVHYLAYPFLLDDALRGVVAVEFHSAGSEGLRDAMRHLQWGTGWVVAMMRNERQRDDKLLLDRTAAVFDIAATVLKHDSFRAAAAATASDLAGRLGCDQVSIGLRQRGRTDVAALSNAAQFGRHMNLVRDIGNAMDEAIDQGALVAYPAISDEDYRVDIAHSDLVRRHETGNILTVPFYSEENFFGAITFERPPNNPFDIATVEVCDSVAAIVGPILRDKQQNDRWIVKKIIDSFRQQGQRLLGPGFVARKIAMAALVVIGMFFLFAKGDYRVTAEAKIEGAVLRSISAPFDGYIASQSARAGMVMQEGDILATLDDQELNLERMRWSTRRAQHLAEFDRAMAEGERAEALISQAMVQQTDAQIDLLDAQLARTVLQAPFDGVVTSGDLSQAVGAVVKRGDPLFEIAPLDAYRVILEVDEADVRDVAVGQTGKILLASVPEDPVSFEVKAITPTMEAMGGRNFYRVEAVLGDIDRRFIPGMEGIAKVDIERRLLIEIWTSRLVGWVRMFIWKWIS